MAQQEQQSLKSLVSITTNTFQLLEGPTFRQMVFDVKY
jgi:hypothetical protein